MAPRSDYSGVPEVSARTEAPDDLQHIQTNPDQFGGAIAQGGERLGSGLIDQAKFYGTVAADNSTNNTLQQVTDVLYGDQSKQVIGPDGQPVPDTGYFGKRGADAMSAHADTASRIDEIIQENRSGLTTPIAKQQYDTDTRRYRAEWMRQVGSHADEQQRTWATDTNNTASSLALNQIARDPMNDANLQQGQANLTKAYVRNAQLKGEDPSGAILKSQQDATLARLRTLSVKDPPSAQKVLDENNEVLAGLPNYDSISRGVKEAVINSQLSPAIDTAVSNARNAAYGQVGNVGAPTSASLSDAILGQESGHNANAPTSVNGAVGVGQMKPGTFAQYAKPGENINNPQDNAAVSKRAVDDYTVRYNGDASRVAVAYFSGPGNVAPAGSATPYVHDYKDGNGKSVSSYVSDVQGRIGATKYPSTADALNANMDQTIQQAQSKAEELFPNYPDAQERYVTGVERRLNQTISQQRQQYEVDTHVVQQAMASDHPPINEQQLMGMSPDVAKSWRSVQVNSPYAAMGIERMFDANSKGKATNLGTNFNSVLNRVLAPATDSNRITNVAQLWPLVQPGEDGTLTNTGAQALNDILGRRTGPGGDAQAQQMQNFLKTAHQMISGSTASIANPKGEKRYGDFLKQALPQIAQAYKTGDASKVYDQKGDLYNSITNFMVPTQTQAGEYIYRTDVKPPDALEGNLATMNLQDPQVRQKAAGDIKTLYAHYPKEAKDMAVRYGFAQADGPPVPLPPGAR